MGLVFRAHRSEGTRAFLFPFGGLYPRKPGKAGAMPDQEQAKARKSTPKKFSSAVSQRVHAAWADSRHHRRGGLSMVRITQKAAMHATGLLCDACGHREIDRYGGLGAIMKRGWWAQSMTSHQRHLCGGCYRGLELMAREGYWRSQPTLAVDRSQA